MKLAKLSLAAMVVAGLATSSFAADTLADAFKNGKVNGELRAWYFDRDRASATPTNDADLLNTGLVLGYVTDAFNGFSMGVTMQSSFSPFADTDAKRVMGGVSGEYGSGAVISEGYLNYALGKTNVKAGRMFLSTPLVAGSGSRIIKQSFEGALITNTDLPNTTLAAGVVTKFQNRTDGNGGAPKFNELNNDHDYAYTILAINKSIPGLTLTAQYASLDNDAKATVAAAPAGTYAARLLAAQTGGFDDYYLEADYKGKAGNIGYGVAANYLYTDWISYDAGTMYGVKASIDWSALKAYVAYSSISDDDDNKGVAAGLGGGAQPNFVKGYQFTSGTYTSDTTGLSVDANYNFKDLGLLVGARYTQLDVASAAATDDDRSYTDLYAVYNFAGALKGLAFDVSYSDMGKDVEGSDLWFKANYKF